MLKAMGADVVGMSTVPEVIAAKHRGVEVLALSLITNKAITARSRKRASGQADQNEGKANHEEVLEVAKQAMAEFEVGPFTPSKLVIDRYDSLSSFVS